MGTPYRECPNCGAHLDAGELCDCRRTEREPRRPEQEPPGARAAEAYAPYGDLLRN